MSTHFEIKFTPMPDARSAHQFYCRNMSLFVPYRQELWKAKHAAMLGVELVNFDDETFAKLQTKSQREIYLMNCLNPGDLIKYAQAIEAFCCDPKTLYINGWVQSKRNKFPKTKAHIFVNPDSLKVVYFFHKATISVPFDNCFCTGWKLTRIWYNKLIDTGIFYQG